MSRSRKIDCRFKNRGNRHSTLNRARQLPVSMWPISSPMRPMGHDDGQSYKFEVTTAVSRTPTRLCLPLAIGACQKQRGSKGFKATVRQLRRHDQMFQNLNQGLFVCVKLSVVRVSKIDTEGHSQHIRLVNMQRTPPLSFTRSNWQSLQCLQ